MTGLAVFVPPVIHDHGAMIVANEEITALVARVRLELPRIVEKLRMIDAPLRPYDWETDPILAELIDGPWEAPMMSTWGRAA